MEKAYGLCDFIIENKENRDIVVLQLSDTQIIDSMQKRTPNRLTPQEDEYWATDKIEERCYGYIREIISSVKPNFIFITGDLVYGQFDDKGTSFKSFVDFMESFCIPWSPVFGNHDNASAKGVVWQCEQLERAKSCLFKKGNVKGNGNYTVGILQGSKLKRVFIMLDTHSGLDDIGLSQDQMEWFTNKMYEIKASIQDVRFSIAMHVPPLIFKEAYAQYGFTNKNTKENPINIDTIVNKGAKDFGYIGGDLKNAWDDSLMNWEALIELGLDSVFVGHEHSNSASVLYKGVRFQFGQKSSAYDRVNYMTSEGKIVTSFLEIGKPIVGGSIFLLDGITAEIVDAYIYLCES